MATSTRELGPTTSRIRSQALQVNTLHNKVQQVLEVRPLENPTKPADAVIWATRSLKDVVRPYNDASRVLTGLYAAVSQNGLLHAERIRRLNCLADVSQVITEFNSRLEKISRSRQSSFDISLSDISTFNVTATSAAEGSVAHPRASTPITDDEDVPPESKEPVPCISPLLITNVTSPTPGAEGRATIAAPAPQQSLLVSAPRNEGTVEPTLSKPWWDEPGRSW